MAVDELEEKTLIEISRLQREAIEKAKQYWRRK